MIENSFLHIPCIESKTEQRLWQSGREIHRQALMPKSGVVEGQTILWMKTTRYFDDTRKRPDRALIKEDWIESAIENPVKVEVHLMAG